MNPLPNIIAFTCGAVVMILELDGSRIIAPYLGTGTFVWTGLIGVILGSLSLGYWWGGKVADKSANFKTLAKILALAGLFVWSIAYLKNLLELSLFLPQSMIAATLIGTTFLFSPATILLGMITPYIARLKLDTLETSGKTIGTLYALSTLGSIIGTFLGGFLLISYLGSTKIITLLATTLFVLAAAAFFKNNSKDKVLIIGCILLALLAFTIKPSGSFSRQIILDTDTEYSRVWIFDGIDKASGRPARYLSNNTRGLQSGMFLDDPDELIFPYTRLFDLAAEMYPNFKKALMIGAGAYSYPKHFARTFPKSSLDVVEIDPELKKLAAEYFALKENPRVATFDEDGRIFLNRNKTRYDIILNDTFLSHLNIPYQLTTTEAIKKMSDALNAKGVVMTNIISAASGPSSHFLQAEYLTYKRIFPSVFLIKVVSKSDTELQNIMLVALKTTG
ncbi:MAG: fused MFS/spermidine synthase, partial [bacterium]|nr:fused MFS/spermidine synthase [bacterium]